MQCKQIKRDKVRCGGHATDDGFCYFHSPHIPETQKRESRVRGGEGRAGRVSEPLQAFQIESTKQLLELLNATVQEVRQGKIDCRVANTIGFLSGHMMRAFEIDGVEKRLTEIETRLAR